MPIDYVLSSVLYDTNIQYDTTNPNLSFDCINFLSILTQIIPCPLLFCGYRSIFDTALIKLVFVRIKRANEAQDLHHLNWIQAVKHSVRTKKLCFTVLINQTKYRAITDDTAPCTVVFGTFPLSELIIAHTLKLFGPLKRAFTSESFLLEFLVKKLWQIWILTSPNLSFLRPSVPEI